MALARFKTLASALIAASCVALAHAAEPLKAGFVYIGPTGDHGWTYSHDEGRKQLEAHSGGRVKTTFVEMCRKPPIPSVFSAIWRKRATKSFLAHRSGI